MQDPRAVEFACEGLRNDKEFVLELLAKDSQGVTLKHAHNLQSDREVVLRAVESNGGALQFASAELRSDKEVVLAAVRRSFHALVSCHPFELPFGVSRDSPASP